MTYVNQCTFAGNLGADPEKRYTNDGRPVVNFRFAVGNRTRDRDTQEWRDDPMWIRVTGFGPMAERVCDQLQRGSRVLVVGRLDTPTTFTRQDNTVSVSVQMVANQIIALDPPARSQLSDDADDEPRRDRPAAQQSRQPAPQRQPVAARPAPRQADAEDLEDLPF